MKPTKYITISNSSIKSLLAKKVPPQFRGNDTPILIFFDSKMLSKTKISLKIEANEVSLCLKKAIMKLKESKKRELS